MSYLFIIANRKQPILVKMISELNLSSINYDIDLLLSYILILLDIFLVYNEIHNI